MRKNTLLIFLILITLSCASQKEFDGLPQEGVPQVRAKTSIEYLESNGTVVYRALVDTTITDGWKIYSIHSQGEDSPPPSNANFDIPGASPASDLRETRPLEDYNDLFEKNLLYHKSHAVFVRDYTTSEVDVTTTGKIDWSFTFTACSYRVCLPPETINGETDIKRSSLGQEGGKSFPPIETLLSRSFNQEISEDWENLSIFIGLAILMALAALLTPCVFPMIPITISYFSKEIGQQKSLLANTKKPLTFGLGIISTFTILGIGVSVIFGASALPTFAANPWVNLGIGIMFVVFALGLMGVIKFNPPTNLVNFLDKESRRREGYLGILLMGGVFSLTSFTCTAQFVGTLLVSAVQGSFLWPLIGMLTFSTVFSLPFVILAFLPGAASKLKKLSGGWMDQTKFVLGILEIGAAFKFFSSADMVFGTNWISRDLMLIAWAISLFAVALYLSWPIIKKTIPKAAESAQPELKFKPFGSRTILIIVFAAISIYPIYGLGNRSMGAFIDSVLPPPSGQLKKFGDYVEDENQVAWIEDFAQGLKKSQETGKPMLIDFTGYSCVNCRWMEQNILSLRKINDTISQHYIPIKLYTDGGEKAEFNRTMQFDRFQKVTLPLYVILSPDDILLATFEGLVEEPDYFAEFLNSNKI